MTYEIKSNGKIVSKVEGKLAAVRELVKLAGLDCEFRRTADGYALRTRQGRGSVYTVAVGGYATLADLLDGLLRHRIFGGASAVKA